MSNRRGREGVEQIDRAEVILPQERAVPGYLAAISDYILDNSQLPVLLGAVTSVALLGYHISTRAESLTEISSLPLLSFRSSYTPQAVYELFEALGPEGRAEYQYINVLGTGAFPALVAVCFAVTISQLFSRAGLPHEWNLLPLVYLAVATAESCAITILLYAHPRVYANVAAGTGILAGFKFRLLTYMALSVVLGAVWLVKTRIQKRFSKKQD